MVIDNQVDQTTGTTPSPSGSKEGEPTGRTASKPLFCEPSLRPLMPLSVEGLR